jgi:putative membrane protein
MWLKALHLIFMVTWFAGLFYLPRLFVYHAMSEDKVSRDRFKIMERKLYFGIMMPGMILTLAFGLWMLMSYAWEIYSQSLWLHIKLGLLIVLVIYHLHCGKLVKDFKHSQNANDNDLHFDSCSFIVFSFN